MGKWLRWMVEMVARGVGRMRRWWSCIGGGAVDEWGKIVTWRSELNGWER